MTWTRRASLLATLLVVLTPPAGAGWPGQGMGVPQVTLFGVLATPGAKGADKELATIAPQLQRLLPNHGFKFLGSRSSPLRIGETLSCPLGGGWSAEVTMMVPMDPEGKVNVRFTIHHVGEPSFQRVVRTPPNQLFFSDITLPDGNRLVLGVGAR